MEQARNEKAAQPPAGALHVCQRDQEGKTGRALIEGTTSRIGDE
jgi:hypothetical protein